MKKLLIRNIRMFWLTAQTLLYSTYKSVIYWNVTQDLRNASSRMVSTIQILFWLFMKLALFVDEIFIENKIYDDAKNRFDYLPLNCGF